MERKNKYTHLIERVAGLPKALAADLLKRQTGLPLAQNYWRLREGKGLLNIFDQTSLDMWSKLISDIRRFTGSPVALPNRIMDDIRAEREQLLNRMEQYRTWLSQGASPVYHYDCYQHGGCVYVTRNFAASLFRNIKYFTLRKLYLCRKWMQKRLQKTTTTGITLPNFDFLA